MDKDALQNFGPIHMVREGELRFYVSELQKTKNGDHFYKPNLSTTWGEFIYQNWHKTLHQRSFL